MTQLVDLRIWLLLLLVSSGCQKLKPESVIIQSYPDLELLMLEQVDLLHGKTVEKTVMLGEESEFNSLRFDSTSWMSELSFLKEINPNQPEYVGAFLKSEEGSEVSLELAEGENGVLKSLIYSKSADQFQYIKASFHEDKDIYSHHREVSMRFTDGLLQSYEINGYQKMMLNDTVRFKISGIVQ